LRLGPRNFTTIDFPGSAYTAAAGINDAGQIVGYFGDSAGLQHGFLKNGTSFTKVDFPASTLTSLTGINRAGQIAGSYEDGTGAFYPFVTDLSTFTMLDLPFCSNPCSGSDHGPNSGGVLVGLFFDDPGVGHGFIARPTSN